MSRLGQKLFFPLICVRNEQVLSFFIHEYFEAWNEGNKSLKSLAIQLIMSEISMKSQKLLKFYTFLRELIKKMSNDK